VQWILKQVKGEYQQAWFSATMPSAIKKLAKDCLGEYTTIEVGVLLKPSTRWISITLPRIKEKNYRLY